MFIYLNQHKTVEPFKVIHFNGYIKCDNQYFRTGKDIESYFASSIFGFNDTIEFIKKAHGSFSIVAKVQNKFFVATDIVRTYPLFILTNSGFTIANSLKEFFEREKNQETDQNNLEQYIASGFVYGNGTIYKNVYALQAGEIVIIEGNKITSERYFEYKPSDKSLVFKSIADFLAALDQVFLSVFSRMVAENKNVNRWIIPLSGGHDSRIIVNYLYRLKLKNIICFSYGTPDNEQSKISKLVAEASGYQWHFVEYTEQKWKKLHDLGLFDEYIEYAFNGVSTPHLQDFLAVYELKKRGVLKDGDVFVPGHALDFLAGSHLTSEDMVLTTPEDGLNRVLKKFGSGVNGNNIKTRINEIQIESHIKPEHFQEYFNWQERQAKFIVNSIRAYEFFGFETRLPFWDRKLVDFWLGVPGEMRIGRKAFFEAEQNGILVKELMKIPFAGENLKIKGYSVEKMVKKILPSSLIKLLLKISKRKLKLNEGLNQIYALKAKSVRELLDPIEDFPEQLKPYFEKFLDRYPWQMDYHFLTTFYTVRKQLDKYKNSKDLK